MMLPKKTNQSRMMNLIQIDAREGKVKLNDAVSPWSADELIDDIEKLYGQNAVEAKMEVGGFTAAADDALETVYFEINSPGGSVPDGYRIFHALENMKQRGVRVVATINGKAASMATVIAMAADHLNITKGSLMLVHDASTGTQGTAEDHLKAAATLEEISAEIAELYAARTGNTSEDMRALMAEDRWMTAREALALGFVDEILTSETGAKAEAFDIGASQGTMVPDMNVFQTRKDMGAKIEALTTQVESFQSDIEAAELAAKEATELLATEKELRIVAETKADELLASLQEKEQKFAEVEAQLAEQVAATEEAKESAGKIATAEIAAAGHPPVDIVDEEAPLTIKEQYAALPPGPERKAFRDKHAAELAAQ